MLYLLDFRVEYPATMSQKELFSIWAREADAALAAKQAGVVVDLWKCAGPGGRCDRIQFSRKVLLALLGAGGSAPDARLQVRGERLVAAERRHLHTHVLAVLLHDG